MIDLRIQIFKLFVSFQQVLKKNHILKSSSYRNNIKFSSEKKFFFKPKQLIFFFKPVPRFPNYLRIFTYPTTVNFSCYGQAHIKITEGPGAGKKYGAPLKSIKVDFFVKRNEFLKLL